MMLKNNTWILGYGFVFNPLINLPVFFWIDVSYENLSYIGTTLHHPLYLVLWAISSVFGLYFFSTAIWSAHSIPYRRWLHALFCIGMILSCLIPYSADMPGWINDLHVWIAIVCVSGFIFSWLKTILYSWLSSSFWILYKALLIIFALGFLAICFAGSINGLSEIIFSIGVNAILSLALFNLSKKDKKNDRAF